MSALSPEQNDRLRTAMRKLLDEEGDNYAAVGRRIGKDPTWIFKLMGGSAGGSLETASLVAREVGKSVAELLDIRPAPLRMWSEIDGWADALEAAQAASQYSDRVWDLVGRLDIQPAPERIEAPMLLSAAALVDGLRAKKWTSGSDTSPPSNRGGGKSHSKIRKPRGRT